MANDRKRVVILGGGFGGLHLALALEKSLAREDDVDVTLVNDENYFQYTPMLPEVVGSDIELSHVVVATRQLFRHVHFFKGTVRNIALHDKRVTKTTCFTALNGSGALPGLRALSRKRPATPSTIMPRPHDQLRLARTAHDLRRAVAIGGSEDDIGAPYMLLWHAADPRRSLQARRRSPRVTLTTMPALMPRA
jgi:hypothetical protein